MHCVNMEHERIQIHVVKCQIPTIAPELIQFKTISELQMSIWN